MGRGDRALILMAKAPVPGMVKTRLTPPLPAREAASLYRCLLEDTAEEMARLRGVRLFLFYAPPDGERRFRAAVFRRYEKRPQAGSDLGERMTGAAAAAVRRGARRTVLVGADCPALSAERVREAFRELASGAPAVFGPSADGGFYLAGLAAPMPALFRGVPWSTESVLDEVVRRCAARGIPYSLLAPERDVDTAEDLPALARWAGARARPACPQTRRWLARFSGPLRRSSTARPGERAPGSSPDRRSRSSERSRRAPPGAPRPRSGLSPP